MADLASVYTKNRLSTINITNKILNPNIATPKKELPRFE